jgi:hypothetical protein
MSYAIQAQGLVKRFGETTALAGADLAARSPRSGTRSPSPGAAWSRSGTTRWSWAT